MSTKARYTRTLIGLLTTVSIMGGLWLLLEPGITFLMVVGILPFVLVVFLVREQWIWQLRQCIQRYQTTEYTSVNQEE